MHHARPSFSPPSPSSPRPTSPAPPPSLPGHVVRLLRVHCSWRVDYCIALVFPIPVSLTFALCSPFTTGARGTSTKMFSSFSSKRLIVTSGSDGVIISCDSPRQKPRRSVAAINPNWQRVKHQAPSAPLLAAGAFVFPRHWRTHRPALRQREMHCQNVAGLDHRGWFLTAKDPFCLDPSVDA